MAREESDREDLLREATALVRRIEFRIPEREESIVFGFRRDGAASIFFGADPVFQFNAAGELRRLYHAGYLFKAEQGRLVMLTRVRTDAAVNLVRHECDAEETKLLLTMVAGMLCEICAGIATKNITVLGQVPPDGDLLPACDVELKRLGGEIKIAQAPRAGA